MQSVSSVESSKATDSRQAPRRSGLRLPPALLSALPLLVLIAVVVGSFIRYLLGQTTPPWDFYGGYLSSAYAWWDLGSFFNPPQFLPYLIGGYPAYLAVQASGWYLPVGLAATLTDYTPHVAAIVQVCTVAFGAAGAYMLARYFRISRLAALVAGLGYLFAAGFFANAQHLDIVRSWAFFPWLLLALSQSWLKSPWRIIASALLWFQFFVGAYPGNLAAAVYLCGAWAAFAAWQHRAELSRYVIWVAVTIGAGAMLSLPKWLPYLVGSGTTYSPGNELTFDAGSVATLLFPFTDSDLANDVSMRPFFVLPVVLVAAFFARPAAAGVRQAGLLIAVSLVLGIGIPFGQSVAQMLPLLDISRFRTADFKMGLVLGLALLGAAGIETIAKSRELGLPPAWWKRRALVAAVAVVLIAAAGIAAGLSGRDLLIGFAWLAVSLLALAAYASRAGSPSAGTGPRRLAGSVVVIAPVLAAVLVGASWALASRYVWETPRVDKEIARWGAPVEELIAEQGPLELPSRPERSAPEYPTTLEELTSSHWNAAEFSRSPTLGGYTTLKGVPQFDRLVAASLDPGSTSTMELLARPSTVWLTSGQAPADEDSGDCALSGECLRDGLVVTKWGPGSISVAVPAAAAGRISLNEVAYPGWTATACGEAGCTAPQPTDSQDFYLSSEVEPGTTVVEFTYRTPLQRQAWAGFALGAGVLALAAVWSALSGRRSAVQRNGDSPSASPMPQSRAAESERGGV